MRIVIDISKQDYNAIVEAIEPRMYATLMQEAITNGIPASSLLVENKLLKEKVELYKKLVEKMQKCVLDNIHTAMLTFIDTKEDVMTDKDKFVLTINKAACENLKKLFEDMSKDPDNAGRKETDNVK